MTFLVAAEAYDRFMGRYSGPLAGELIESAGVGDLPRGARVLDVGCGPGALTTRLVERLGAEHVSAVDPSPPFLDALRSRLPGVDARPASAEDLPFDDGAFDAALAQLVVQFMSDPVAGLREMARVTRPGGVVAACVWDHAGGGGPLTTFWRAARDVDPRAPGEDTRAGTREGDLPRLLRQAGLADVDSGSLTVTVRHETFEQWWEPYTAGVGPAGAYLARLDDGARAAVRDRCADLLGPAPFDVTATAWCARGRA